MPDEPVDPAGPVDPAVPDEPVEPVELPELVRQRVVALAAEALPHLAVDQLPTALRRVAGFTPARRARLASTPIAMALDTDEAFRERVAGRVRSTHPELAGPIAESSDLPASDPVEVAALTYLLRPDGWAELVRTAADRAFRAQARGDRAGNVERERVQRRLDDTRGQLRRVQERSREQLAVVKAENTDLRHGSPRPASAWPERGTRSTPRPDGWASSRHRSREPQRSLRRRRGGCGRGWSSWKGTSPSCGAVPARDATSPAPVHACSSRRSRAPPGDCDASSRCRRCTCCPPTPSRPLHRG